MISVSFQQLNTAVLLAALSLFSSINLAEVRVIVEYSSTEYRVLRVVELPLRRKVPISDHLDGKVKVEITPADAVSKVKLLWFSADGVLINTAVMDDPRLTHAPLSSTEQSPTMVGLEAGAFVVSGPSGSAVLEVHLPANATLGLDRQFWRLDLI